MVSYASRRVLLPLVAIALMMAGCSASEADSTGARAGAAAGGGTTSTSAAVTTTTDGSSVPAGAVAPGAAVRSAGCDTDTGEKLDLEKVAVGADRYYLISTPGGDGDTPKPVVLDLHGLLEGAQVHSQMSGFGPYAQANDFIAVFPHGRGDPVKWDVTLDRKGNPDLVYLDALLDQVEAEHCVDTSRIYATGLSFGAIMSSTLGCVMTDRIAAIAPVAGLNAPEECQPERPVPVLTFHGTADPILLFNGGVANLDSVLTGEGPASAAPEADLGGPGYPTSAAAWAEQNGCTGDPSDRDLTDTVIERTWTCPAEAPVVFDIEVGAGHSWPGSEFSKNIEKFVGPTDVSIDGTDHIWKFFQRFQLPPT